MKKYSKMISMMLAVMLLLSLSGAAYADPISVAGSSVSVAVNVARTDGEESVYLDADGAEQPVPADSICIDGALYPACSVTTVDRGGNDLYYVESSVDNLLNQDLGLQIVPAEGYYITAMSMAAGDAQESRLPLLTGATASLQSAAVTLYLRDIATLGSDGVYYLDGDYLSTQYGGAFVLAVTCRKMSPDESFTISYSGGDVYVDNLPYYSNYGPWTFNVESFPATSVTDDSGTAWDLSGMLLEYADGARRVVNPGDPILVYQNASITAQWTEGQAPEPVIEDQMISEFVDDGYTSGEFVENNEVGNDEIVYAESYEPQKPAIPAVTLELSAKSKEFDGYPLVVDPGTETTVVTAADGTSLMVNVDYAGGSFTDIGSYTNSVTNYNITYTDGTLLYSKDELDASGVFRVFDGTVTITEPSAKQTLTVTAVSDTVTITAKDQVVYATECGQAQGFSNGYKVSGLMDGHHIAGQVTVTGQGSESFATTVDTSAMTVVMDNGQNVTPLYTIQAVDGYVTIIEDIPPEKPAIPTVTLQAPDQSKEFDGLPLSMDGGTSNTVITDPATGTDLKVSITYAGGSLTDIGTVANEVTNYAIYSMDDELLYDKAALDAAEGFRVLNGTLSVTEPSVKQTLTVTAVSDTVTVATAGEEVFAKDCGKESGFTDGYKATGLMEGHRIEGENIVTSHGTASFETAVDVSAIHVLMENGQDVTPLYTIQPVNGYITVNQPAPAPSTEPTPTPTPSTEPTPTPTPSTEPTPTPTPSTEPSPAPKTIPTATLQGASETREYNGQALTKSGTDGYSVSAGSLEGYTLRVAYNSITEPGSVDTLASYELCNPDGSVAFTKAELDASPNFTVNPGKLTIDKRTLKITGISGTITTHGETITASTLSSQDKTYQNGYKAEGLLEEHQISGNFVEGSSKQSFRTVINKDAIRITARGDTAWDVKQYYNIQSIDGYITINDLSPNVYDLIVNPKSTSWIYDGTTHALNDYDYAGLVDGDRLDRVNFAPDSVITDVGTKENRIVSVEVSTANGGDVDPTKYVLTSTPGTLQILPRDLTITAISGTLTTSGAEIVASSLSTPDGNFKNGYKVENLVTGHTLSGNFVVGRGTTTFNTSIDLNQLRILDANGRDVTGNYNIRTIGGTITINSTQRSNVTLNITAKSGTFPYDGNQHKLEEFTSSGLVDGDVIEKVTFKPTSVITDVGTQSNEIQSVVIKSSSGAAVDNSKYNINFYSGTLTVTKFPLTLTAVSDEKAYDGQALNNKNVKASALANAAHKLSADYEVFDSNGNTIKNGPVDPGVYIKKVSNVKITSGNQDVTANYEISTVDGTLKITGAGGSTSKSTLTTAYYGSTYTIRSEAPYSEFQYLLIDGQRVPADSYTVKEGSTIITLKASYIQNLKTGNHNYSIVSKTMQSDGTFNVTKAPRTGDGAKVILWILLLVAAAVAVAVIFYVMKRGGKFGRKPPKNNPPKNNPPRSGSSRGGSGNAGTGSARQSSQSSERRSDGARSSSSASGSPRSGAWRSEGYNNAALRRKPVVPDLQPETGAATAAGVAATASAATGKYNDTDTLDLDAILRDEKEQDPTVDLVKDFKLDLDEFRPTIPTAAAVNTAAQETATPDIEVEVFEDTAPTVEEVVEASEKAVVKGEASSNTDTDIIKDDQKASSPAPSAEEKKPETRVRGKHEKPDTDEEKGRRSWYQS